MTTIGFGDKGIIFQHALLNWVGCPVCQTVTEFSEPTFQDGEGIESDYKTPIFGFKSDILAIYRFV